MMCMCLQLHCSAFIITQTSSLLMRFNSAHQIHPNHSLIIRAETGYQLKQQKSLYYLKQGNKLPIGKRDGKHGTHFQ